MVFGLALAWALVGCKPASPERAAERFIDAYYIERDHQKALSVSTGAAADRVQSEAKLVEEARAAGASQSAVQPHVYYNLRKRETGSGDPTLLYALTIDSGGVQLKKEVRLSVRKMQDAAYRISYFSETDVTPR
jgi:hypothetical protein